MSRAKNWWGIKPVSKTNYKAETCNNVFSWYRKHSVHAPSSPRDSWICQYIGQSLLVNQREPFPVLSRICLFLSTWGFSDLENTLFFSLILTQHSLSSKRFPQLGGEQERQGNTSTNETAKSILYKECCFQSFKTSATNPLPSAAARSSICFVMVSF